MLEATPKPCVEQSCLPTVLEQHDKAYNLKKVGLEVGAFVTGKEHNGNVFEVKAITASHALLVKVAVCEEDQTTLEVGLKEFSLWKKHTGKVRGTMRRRRGTAATRGGQGGGNA